MIEKNKGGRPKAIINEKQFTELCQIQCTQEEICAVLDVDDKTLTDWCKRTYKKSFSEIFSQKRHGGKTSLRRAQWLNATNGNVPMQIWLGKQYLDQTDKPVEEDQNEKAEPVQVIINTYDASRSPSEPTTE